jgi:hypothetical protein
MKLLRQTKAGDEAETGDDGGESAAAGGWITAGKQSERKARGGNATLRTLTTVKQPRG